MVRRQRAASPHSSSLSSFQHAQEAKAATDSTDSQGELGPPSSKTKFIYLEKSFQKIPLGESKTLKTAVFEIF
jgi:hypothetical protein